MARVVNQHVIGVKPSPCSLIALLVTALLVRPVKAADWPQFLGPNRNGLSAEKNLIEDWPARGLKELWRVDAGIGMSGISIASGKAVTMWQNEDDQFVVALDASDGKLLWKRPVAPAFRNSMGNGPRSTPTIDGDLVFAFTGEGVLAALKLADGSLVWKHEVLEELNANQADYGMACSPLVVDALVIITPGAAGGAIVAYEKANGRMAWKSGSDSAGYSSPALLEIGGRRQVVAFTGESAIGLVPDTGAPLWRYLFKTDYDCNVATPISVGGKVLISAGENRGTVLLEPRPATDGLRIHEVWASLGTKSILRAEWQTPALVDGYLYALDNVGSAGPVTNLVCVEAATGKLVWEERRFGKGNLTYADGKLFIATMVGEIIVARADPRGYVEIGRAAIMGGMRQGPALADGRLYLRDNREVLCLDVRRP